MKIGGIILSGGKSRRMESDKSLKKINNRTLLEIVIEKSMKQLDYIFINSNNLENYNFKGKKIDVVKDCIKGYLGPLVGILTGMKWLKNKNNNFNASKKATTSVLKDEKYIANIAIIVALSALISRIIDYQFKITASNIYQNQENLLNFEG